MVLLPVEVLKSRAEKFIAEYLKEIRLVLLLRTSIGPFNDISEYIYHLEVIRKYLRYLHYLHQKRIELKIKAKVVGGIPSKVEVLSPLSCKYLHR
jgi:hypothetical protein